MPTSTKQEYTKITNSKTSDGKRCLYRRSDTGNTVYTKSSDGKYKVYTGKTKRWEQQGSGFLGFRTKKPQNPKSAQSPKSPPQTQYERLMRIGNQARSAHVQSMTPQQRAEYEKRNANDNARRKKLEQQAAKLKNGNGMNLSEEFFNSNDPAQKLKRQEILQAQLARQRQVQAQIRQRQMYDNIMQQRAIRQEYESCSTNKDRGDCRASGYCKWDYNNDKCVSRL